MSLIIKGMDKPTNCSGCPCISDNFMFCRAASKSIPMTGHPKFCPLVDDEISYALAVIKKYCDSHHGCTGCRFNLTYCKLNRERPADWEEE